QDDGVSPEGARRARPFRAIVTPIARFTQGCALGCQSAAFQALGTTAAVGGVSEADDGCHCRATSASETPPTLNSALARALLIVLAAAMAWLPAKPQAAYADEIQVAQNPIDPISIAADAATHWREGVYD